MKSAVLTFCFEVVGSFKNVFAVVVRRKLAAQYFVTYNISLSVLVVVVGMASKDILCCDFFLHDVISILSEECFVYRNLAAASFHFLAMPVFYWNNFAPVSMSPYPRFYEM